jgi:hypothetical protein
LHFSQFAITDPAPKGAIAQLGERLHGMQEVGGSIPPGSTNLRSHGELRLASRKYFDHLKEQAALGRLFY